MITNVNTYSYTTLDQLNEAAEQLNEAYFGEGPIKDIQAQFSKFRAKWKGKPYNPKVNYDPDLIKFNRMCEKLFGYSKFCMMIDPSNDYNAYMFNIEALTFGDEIQKAAQASLRVQQNGNGFAYAAGSGICAACMLLYGFLRDEDITDRHIIGVMLHEIGHSFTYAVLKKGGMLSKGSMMARLLNKVNDLVKNNVENDRDMSQERVERDIGGLSFIDKIKGFFMGLRKDKTDGINSAVHSFADSAAARSGRSGNVKHYDYTNEKFADTFAGMYGYSVEVQEALDIIRDKAYDFVYGKNVRTPGKVSIFINVALMSFSDWLSYIFNIKDEHPDGVTRSKVQIEYLEREIRNTDMDPAMKAELQRQIDAHKKLINDYLNYKGDHDAQAIMRAYYKKLYEKFGGDRRERDTDNNDIFSTIDNAYNHTARMEAALLGVDYVPYQQEQAVDESAIADGDDDKIDFGSPFQMYLC